MGTTPLEEKSLKDMSKGLKHKKEISDYLNIRINIALLGQEVFNKKEAENIFDINGIGKNRYSKYEQELYLVSLLKASTPNYTQEAERFNFNTKDRIGWIVLEFDIYERMPLSNNIKNIHEHIYAAIKIEPTLIYVQEKKIYVGFFFPNAPTTKDEDRLRKYKFFKHIRVALTHTLNALWSVEVKDYNEVKAYSNMLQSNYKLFGNIFELGAFKDLLNNYMNSSLSQKIILKKQSYAGKKSGVTKRSKSSEERQKYVQKAKESLNDTSREKLKKTLLYMLTQDESPDYRPTNIVRVSQKIFTEESQRGLARKTVVKFLKEVMSELNIE